MAQELGLTVTAWSPLAGGVLTGKYLNESTEASEARYASADMQQFMGDRERGNSIAREIKAVSESIGKSAAQVALAWLRTRQQPIIPIIGTRKLAQLKDNLESLNVELSTEHLKQLDESSRIELGFPHDFYNLEMVRNFVYAGLADRIDIK